MTTPGPSMQPSYDVLGSPEPAARHRGRGGLLIGLVGAAALAVAGSAVAVAAYLGGGGAQPEDVVPANAIGMIKIDLDPSAAQKVAVYRLAKRFPSTQGAVEDEDSVKDQLLASLFGEQGEVDYDRDVQPWIGDRAAAALLPGAEGPSPLLAVAYTDRGRAEQAMERFSDQDDELFFAFSAKADYVLVGDAQDVVDAAAGTTEVLADTATWGDGMDALDGDQIVTAWADLDRVYAALPQEARDEAARTYGLETGDLALGGVLVAGAHAAAGHVELVGKAIDLESPVQLQSTIGGGSGSGLVQDLPDDTLAALSVTGLGSGLTEVFDVVYGEDDPLGIVASARDLGVSLPEDLRTLLGDETVAAVLGEQDIALRTRADDVDAAYEGWTRITSLAAGGDPASMVRRVDGGVAVGSNPQALDRVVAGGDLGGTQAFRSAVPDAEDAGYVLYVHLARALDLTGQDLGPDAEVLESLGITGSGDRTSSTFRLRLTVAD